MGKMLTQYALRTFIAEAQLMVILSYLIRHNDSGLQAPSDRSRDGSGEGY